jgi:hypothetical protein
MIMNASSLDDEDNRTKSGWLPEAGKGFAVAG